MTKNDLLKLLEGKEDAITAVKNALYDIGEDEDAVIARKVDDKYHIYKYTGVYVIGDEK